MHKFSAIAFSATRRAMTISTGTVRHPGKFVFCAEAPPDAIASVLASDTASLAFKKASTDASGQVASTYAQAVASIAARNPLVEVYRTAVYSICQLYADGAIDEAQVFTLVDSITRDVVAKMDGAAVPVKSEPPKLPELPRQQEPHLGTGSQETPKNPSTATCKPESGTKGGSANDTPIPCTTAGNAPNGGSGTAGPPRSRSIPRRQRRQIKKGK